MHAPMGMHLQADTALQLEIFLKKEGDPVILSLIIHGNKTLKTDRCHDAETFSEILQDEYSIFSAISNHPGDEGFSSS